MAGLVRCYKGQPGVADALAYTAPPNGCAVKDFRAINFDTVSRIVYLGTGGTANTDLLLPPIPIDAGGMLTETDLISIAGGQTLHIKASAAGVITVHIMGYEF